MCWPTVSIDNLHYNKHLLPLLKAPFLKNQIGYNTDCYCQGQHMLMSLTYMVQVMYKQMYQTDWRAYDWNNSN